MISAFPQKYTYNVQAGMSLLDYFAAAALPTLFRSHGLDDAPKRAYEIAERMMVERGFYKHD